jgi:hypothetical protein
VERDEFIDTIINTSVGGSNGSGDDDPVEWSDDVL